MQNNRHEIIHNNHMRGYHIMYISNIYFLELYYIRTEKKFNINQAAWKSRWSGLRLRDYGLCMKIVFVFWDGDYLWKLLTYSDFGKVQAWHCSAFFTTTDISLNFDFKNTCLFLRFNLGYFYFKIIFFLKKQRAPYSWTLLCKQ